MPKNIFLYAKELCGENVHLNSCYLDTISQICLNILHKFLLNLNKIYKTYCICSIK